MQAAAAGTVASTPKGTSDGLPELAQELMAKASDMSSAVTEQHAQPTLRCAAQTVHQMPRMVHHASLPGSSGRGHAVGHASHLGASSPHAAVLHCSQRQEHTSRLLEAATQQAEDAGISDEEPDVQLALMAAEMRCR
jgi:hypothetical protein